ncbi:MAG: aromatic amino acid transport family protein [Patescibacteria group bacterium]|nr:aromatic amino acid transport family protein [Patescibacteria group bacterium]
MKISKNYFMAVAVLVGAITGAGVFAMPFVLTHSGLWPFVFWFPILVAVQCLIHLLFAKVILSTKGLHRVPGYTEIYAGKNWKKIVSIFAVIGGWGTILAYIILGGVFFNQFFSPLIGGSLFTNSLIFFALETVVVIAGLKTIAGSEMIFSFLLLILFVVLSVKCFGRFDLSNFTAVNWEDFFLPYGVIFFAIGGDAAIPEVVKLLDKEKEKIKSAILWGTILPAVMMFIFVIATVGAMGALTTADALSGLNKFFGNGFVSISLLFGLICIATSFWVFAQAVREIFWWDFKINKYWSLVLAVGVPLAFFIFGFTNLTTVVSLSGAITSGVLGIILISLTAAVDREGQKKSPIAIKTSRPLAIVLYSLFIVGFLTELWTIIFKL